MFAIGMDVGGTNLAAGLVNDKGEILQKLEKPTIAFRAPEVVMDDMADMVRSLAEAAGGLSEVSSAGFGLPGVVDMKRGVLVFADNLGWQHIDIVTQMHERLGLPVFAGNDANVAALAETKAGAGAGVNNSVMLTLGTGLGGGIIIEGKIYTGAHYVGGEIGHQIIEVNGRLCNCGVRGCFERYASATALIMAGRHALAENPNGAIGRAAGGSAEAVTARMVVDLAKSGDRQASAIWEEYLHYLCSGMVSLVNLFDPEVFIIGGGVSSAGDFLLTPLRERLPKMVSFRDAPQARIELATLGNDAGIIGAAMLGLYT